MTVYNLKTRIYLFLYAQIKYQLHANLFTITKVNNEDSRVRGIGFISQPFIILLHGHIFLFSVNVLP